MTETCEVVLRWEPNPDWPKKSLAQQRIAEQCGKPATWRYPAMGGDYMYLCDEHGQRHKEYAEQGWGDAPSRE